MDRNDGDAALDAVRVVPGAPRTRVLLSGEHDLATRGRVHSSLQDATEAGGDVLVDLTAATFFDAGVLGELASCEAALRSTGNVLSVHTRSARAAHLFAIAGLGGLLEGTTVAGTPWTATGGPAAVVGRASWPIDGLPVPAAIFAGDTLVDANRPWCAVAGSRAGTPPRPSLDAIVADDRDPLVERIAGGDEREPSLIRMVDGSVLRVQIRRLRSGDPSPVLVTMLPFVPASVGSADSLTGLLDGPAFAAEVRGGLGAPVDGCTAVLVADLDRFKQVNDRHGHLVGNQVLIIAASRILSVTGTRDVVARLGGDEFGVLLARPTQEDVVAVADALVTALGRPMVVGRQELVVTASVGVAVAVEPGAVADGADGSRRAVVERADRAMYRAKRDGGSGRRLFEPGDHGDPDLVHQARVAAAFAVDDLERAGQSVLLLWEEAMVQQDDAATAALANESHRIRRALEELRRVRAGPDRG